MRNFPIMDRNIPSPTSFVYVEVDEGSVERFVSNGFLTLDPGKWHYEPCISPCRGALNLTRLHDSSFLSASGSTGYQLSKLTNWAVLQSKCGSSSKGFIVPPQFVSLGYKTWTHNTTANNFNGIARLIEPTLIATSGLSAEIVLPLWPLPSLLELSSLGMLHFSAAPHVFRVVIASPLNQCHEYAGLFLSSNQYEH